MAHSRISLACLVLLFVASCNASKTELRGERWRTNPYILKKKSHERLLATGMGEIRAVPIFRRSSMLARSLRNFELNCINIRPRAFMLPHFSNADRLLVVVEGKARVGFVVKDKWREDDLEKGMIQFVPKGSVFYAINTDNNKNLEIVNLLYNADPYRHRHHDSFYVGGGRNPPTIFNGFSRDVLEAAFKTEWQRIQRVISKQEMGVFVPFTGEHRQKMEENLSAFRTGRSNRQESREEQYEPFNLQQKTPKFKNNNGQYIIANSDDFAPLGVREERQELGVSYAKIEPGKMTAPYWSSEAIKIGVVIRGRGRIQIVAPEGVAQRQRGGGIGREREEDFKLSYNRVEDYLEPGDVYVIPAGHPSVEIATSKQRLDILSFFLGNQHNHHEFLAGKFSVLRRIKPQILAAAFNSDEREVRALTEAQDQAIFVDGPKGTPR